MSTYVEDMKGVILSQYQDSALFISFLQSLAFQADELDAEIQDVIDQRWVHTANGKNLDIVGELVGIRREVVDFVDSIYFGFDPDPTALGFADINNDSIVAGRYRDANENPVVIRLLADEEYRTFIVAKILTNTSRVTPDSVLLITREILKVMFIGGGDIPVDINELTNAAFEIVISADLDGADQAFIAELGLIPRPAGVRINYVYTTPLTTLLTAEGLTLFADDNTQLEID